MPESGKSLLKAMRSFFARSRVDRARAARGRGFCSRTPSNFFSSVGRRGDAGYIGLSLAGRRGWGDRSPTPRLAERRKIVRQTIMHRVMLLTGKAEQVPRTPGVLGIILRGPDVVHGRGINPTAEPRRFAALVPVAPQDAAPQFSPARCVITCPSHTDLRVSSGLPAIGLSPPGKQKDRNRQTPSLESFIGSGLPDTGQQQYSRRTGACTSGSTAAAEDCAYPV